jgi:hypothetical protein
VLKRVFAARADFAFVAAASAKTAPDAFVRQIDLRAAGHRLRLCDLPCRACRR